MRDRRRDGTSHRGASCVPPGLWPAQRRSTVQAPSCSASALAAGSPALHRQSRPLGLCFPGTQAEMPPPHAAAPEFSRDCRKVHQEPGQARHVIQAHSSPGAPASALTHAISGSAAHDPHFFPPSPDVPRFLFPQGLCLFRASASSGLLRPIQTGEPATRAAELRPAQRGAARALLPSPSHLPGALTLAWIGLGSSVTIKYWVTLLAKLCVGPPCYWLPCSSHLRLSV